MANVANGVEILLKISIAWVGRTNVTDRRTDGRRHITFAKNYCYVQIFMKILPETIFDNFGSLPAMWIRIWEFLERFFNCDIRHFSMMVHRNFHMYEPNCADRIYMKILSCRLICKQNCLLICKADQPECMHLVTRVVTSGHVTKMAVTRSHHSIRCSRTQYRP